MWLCKTYSFVSLPFTMHVGLVCVCGSDKKSKNLPEVGNCIVTAIVLLRIEKEVEEYCVQNRLILFR